MKKKKVPNKILKKKKHRLTLDCYGINYQRGLGKLTISSQSNSHWDTTGHW